MIVYHQAFDLYHTVYRMLHILTHFDKEESVEIDRLRIWDFYLLFPNKLHIVKLKRNEEDVKKLIKQYIPRKENPYELFIDNRKMFEKIKPSFYNSGKFIYIFMKLGKFKKSKRKIS